MNKQNKKIAQEKRRIEREKAEKKAKVVNLLKFWVPVVAVVVVVIVLPIPPQIRTPAPFSFRKSARAEWPLPLVSTISEEMISSSIVS